MIRNPTGVFPAMIAAMTAVALAGCQTPPVEQQGLNVLIDPIDAGRLGYTTQWASSLAIESGQRIGQAVILDDILVTVEWPSNIVVATELSSGKQRWARALATSAERLFKPGRSGDFILINSDTQIYSLSAKTGKIQHIHDLPQMVRSGPAMYENLAIFGGLNGLLFAYNIDTGYLKWKYLVGGQILASPAIYEDTVVVASSLGHYALFRARNGRKVWDGRTFDRISAEPVITALGVFIASEDHSLYALHRTTGLDRWIHRETAPLTTAPMAIENTLYVTRPREALVAISAVSGKQLWDEPILGDKRPVAIRDQVLALHGRSSILLADVETGTLLDQAPTRELQTILPTNGGSLVLIAPNGRLVRLDPKRW